MARRAKERMFVDLSLRNPFHDLTCSPGFVYRFISTGTIEEKIFQRQANKQALSSAVVDEKEDAERHFSIDALRQLFLFNEKTLCETHETFKCKRCKNGKQMIKSPALLYGDASTYVSYHDKSYEATHTMTDGIISQTQSFRTITTTYCVLKWVCQKSRLFFSTLAIS